MPQDIRAQAAQFVEALFSDEPHGVGDFVTAGFAWQGPSLLGRNGGGVHELQVFSRTLRAALPDMRVSVETRVVEGNAAVVRWTVRGCHKGDALAKATGRLVLFTGIHFLSFAAPADGPWKVERLCQQWGQMGLLQNLGVIPFIGGPGTELPGPSIETEEAIIGVAASPNRLFNATTNKEMIGRLFDDVINKNDPRLIDDWVAKDISDHNPGPSDLPGRDGIKQVCNLLRKAFPDFNGIIDEMIAEEDKVAVRWTVRGTNSCTCGGIGATGKQMTGTGIDIVRIATTQGGHRQVVDRWGNSDDTGILLQLGVISPEMLGLPK